MMCYRDMTYCDATECKNFHNCFRALTDSVRVHADELGLPICQFHDPTQNECYQPKKSDDEGKDG